MEPDKNTNSLNDPFALSRRWSSLRSRLRADNIDLVATAALVLFVTGAVLMAIVICGS